MKLTTKKLKQLVRETLAEAIQAESDEKRMQKAFAKKKGSLHRDLGVPEDKDIPVSKMADALSKGGKEEEKARAAVNANPDKYGSIKDVGVEKKD